MRIERIQGILNKIIEKYYDRSLTPEIVDKIYAEISSVVRGLHRTEHFLNVHIDHTSKVILVRDEETIMFLGALPFLDNKLMRTNEMYLVYSISDNGRKSECAVRFKDLYEGKTSGYLGFDIDITPIILMGVYYPDTKKFEIRRNNK